MGFNSKLDVDKGIKLGTKAVESLELFPECTVSNVKRIIGLKFSSANVEIEKKYATYEIVENNKNGECKIKLPNEKEITPEEVSSYILAILKAAAEVYCKCKISNCIICVPAYFSESQRSATINAATLVGLNVVRLLHEPCASAIAYGLFVTGKKNVLCVDWGGGI